MPPANTPRPARGRPVVAGLILLAGAAAAGTAFDRHGYSDLLAADTAPVKPEPQELFTGWPKGQKPDLVLVITGQTYGYLQKCGCSNPQKGGLERRYNFIESLKARGWEVVGLDLGDVMKPLPYTPTNEQTLTKYEYAMKAMKLMGYQGVAVGEEELKAQLLNPLQKYTLQKGNAEPKVHFANIDNRVDFPGPHNGSSLVESDIVTKNGVTVGVAGVVGAEAIQAGGFDNSVKYTPKDGAALAKVLGGWVAGKKAADLNVLLYNGPLKWTDPAGKKLDAEQTAMAFPKFNVVVCLTKDSEPPNMPTAVRHKDGSESIIVQVGHRGQNVGVIGVFKTAKGTELHYQRVTMADEFDTPAGTEAGNPMLKLLQEYSDTVKTSDFLSEIVNRKKNHPVQALKANAAFAGDSQCVACHKAETDVYAKTKHASAHAALVNIAAKPTGRQFDGECIVCHTVGYEYKTGFVNQKVTPNLMNVQCESCHGPASLHVAEEAAIAKANNPPARQHLASLSPWKAGGAGKLPPVEKFAAMMAEKDTVKREAMMTPAEKQVYQGVYQTCAKCHDPDNDPKFELADYWKTVAHTGLAPKVGLAPKK